MNKINVLFKKMKMFKRTKLSHNISAKNGEILKGEGPLISEEKDPSLFKKLWTSIETIVHVGHSPRMKINAQKNLLHIVDFKCDHEHAVVATSKSYQSTQRMFIELWTPNLIELRAVGIGDVIVDGVNEIEFFIFHDGIGSVSLCGNAKHFTAELNSIGNSEFRGLDSEAIIIRHSGSGNVKMNGSVDELRVHGSGMGNIDLQHLKSNTAVIKHGGMGNLNINVSKVAAGNASGMGDVRIYGDGSSKINHTGMGKIIFR